MAGFLEDNEFADLIPKEEDNQKLTAKDLEENEFADLIPQRIDDDRSSFTRGVSSGIDQLQGLTYGLGALAADAVGADDFRERMIEGYERNQVEAAQNAPEIDTFEKAKETGRYGSYAAGVLGNLVPTMATMVGTGGVGGAVAKTVGKQAVEKYAEKAVKKGLGEKLGEALAQDALRKKVALGQTLGAAAGSMGMEAGEIYGDVAAEGAQGTKAILSSIAGGAVAGGIDVLPFMRVARKFGLGSELRDRVTKEIYKRVPLEALKQMPLEASTEAIQTAIEEGTKAFIMERDLPEDLGNMMLEAAVAGGIGGFAMGGIGGLPSQSAVTQEDIDKRNELDALHASVKYNQPVPDGLKPLVSEDEFFANEDKETFHANIDPDAGLKTVAEPAPGSGVVSVAAENINNSRPEVELENRVNPFAGLQTEGEPAPGPGIVGLYAQKRSENAKQKTAKAKKEDKAETPTEAPGAKRIQELTGELNSISDGEGDQIVAYGQKSNLPEERVINALNMRIRKYDREKSQPKPISVDTQSVNPDVGLETAAPKLAPGVNDVKQIFKQVKKKPVSIHDFEDVPISYPDEKTIADNEAVKDPATFKEMKRMASKAGWQEIGGRILYGEDGKTVIGRTNWLPFEEWFSEKPEGVAERHFKSAVEKLEKGEKLLKPEREAAAFMLYKIQENKARDSKIDLFDGELESSNVDNFSNEIIKLSEDLNAIEDGKGDAALERAAIKGLSNKETEKKLKREIKAIEFKRKAKSKANEKKTAPVESKPTAPQETDLAGVVDKTKQAIADLEREKDATRNATEKEPESLSKEGDDLFNDGGRLEPELFDASNKQEDKMPKTEGKAEKKATKAEGEHGAKTAKPEAKATEAVEPEAKATKTESKPETRPSTPKQETPNESGTGRLRHDGDGSLEKIPAKDVEVTESRRKGDSGNSRSSDKSAQPGKRPDSSGTESGRSRGDRAARPDTTSTRDKDNREQSTRPGNESERDGDLVEHSNQPKVDFVIDDDLGLGEGGQIAKYNGNIEAIKLLKTLEKDNREATSDEKKVLAKYVGWGGIPNAFKNPITGKVAKGWENKVEELESILTKKELAAARASTRNAHYTSKEVVDFMWKAVERLGFTGGGVLEPSMGTGNFIGLRPQEENLFVTGVELDSVTSRIAGKLYPNTNVFNMSFGDLPAPKDRFDLVIGNPPFGKNQMDMKFLPEYNKKSIHNQFFLGAMETTKPGGIVAMVVSRYMLDAQNKETRRLLAEQMELIGAIRLPGTAFKENAGTEVVTDIIFLRKRHEPSKAQESWVNTTMIRDPLGGAPIVVNQYFADHPDMVIGRLDRSGTMQHGADVGVTFDGDIETALQEALDKLPKVDAKQDEAGIENAKLFHESFSDAVAMDVSGAQVGEMFYKDGNLLKVVLAEDPGGSAIMRSIPVNEHTPWSDTLYLDSSGNWYEMVPKLDEKGNKVKEGRLIVREKKIYTDLSELSSRRKLGKARFEKLKKLIEIRDLIKKQIELESSLDDAMESNRTKLKQAYDAFVKKYGLISGNKNASLISSMPDEGLVLSLEHNYRPEITPARAKMTGAKPRKESAEQNAILERPVSLPPEAITKADSIEDAVAITMSDTGRLTISRIADLTGKSKEDAESALLEKGLAFKDPEQNGILVDKNEYLSGNVRRKLSAAKEAGLPDNIKALEAVQPKRWESDKINPVFGAVWIPDDIYTDFIRHLSGEANTGSIRYHKLTNAFDVYGNDRGVEATTIWGTPEYPMPKLVSAILNNQKILVSSRSRDGETIIHEAETEAAKSKAREIQREFTDWIFSEAQRRNRLTDLFNDLFNVRVNRQFDGSHMRYPGKTPVITMRRGQNNAIWRGIVQRSVLYDHSVGSGKTISGAARAIERKRMGISNKPMVVVPNHLVGQWGREIYRLYPGVKALIPNSKSLSRKNRRRFFAQIATGDWDIIVIPHSFLGFIQLSKPVMQNYLRQEINIVTDALNAAREAAKNDGSSGRKPLSVKKAENMLERLESRYKRVTEKSNTDDLLSFEQLGIDDLTVDESHEFKNLAYSTSLNAVKGLGNPQGSDKAMDLFFKTKYLHEQKGGIAFLTGTPISNSAVEMYTIMRFLAPDLLKELSLEHFDAFRAQFVEVDSKYEPTDSGNGLKRVDRLGRKWSNMRALMDAYYSFADVVTNNDIKQWYKEDNDGKEYPIPKVKSGDRVPVKVNPTPTQERIIQEVVEGFDSLKSINDWMERNKERLRLMDRARKISLHAKAVDPSFTDEAGGKLDAVADRTKEIYDKWNDDRGTQLIFLDRGIPKTRESLKAMKEYDALVRKSKAAIDAGNESAYRKYQDQLDTYDQNEIEAMRAASSGGWNAYQHIKDNLVSQGIPENEIAFIHDYDTPAKKSDLFAAVNLGEIRVLIGSTPRMGAGTNVQERLVALHHVDATWKPSDIEQREGRIIRPGNKLLEKYGDDFEVEILAYVTERTVDAKLWNLNATKLKMINGIRFYDGQFEMSFDDDSSISMAEISAIASGDPNLLRRFELEGEVEELHAERVGWLRSVRAADDELLRANKIIESADEKLKKAKRLDESYADFNSRREADKREITIDGEKFTDRHGALFYLESNQEKGRRFNVNGEAVSHTKAIKLVGDTMGDASKVRIEYNGKTYIKRTDYAKDLAKDIEGKSGVIQAGSLYGVPIELDIDSDYIEMSLIVDDGTKAGNTVTGYLNLLVYNGKKDAESLIKSVLHRVSSDITVNSLTRHADEVQSALREAEKNLARYEEAANKPFKKQEELEQKQKELDDLERMLANESEQGNEGAQQEDDAALRRAGNRNAGNVSMEQINTIVDRVVPKNNIENVIVVDTYDALPDVVKQDAQKQGAERGDIEAAYKNGVVYIVRDMVTDEPHVERLLFHEAVHKGLSIISGRDVKTAMNRLYVAMGGVKGFNRMADKFGIDLTEYRQGVIGKTADGKPKYDTETRNHILVEELLAHIGEEESKSIKAKARELLGAIREWLRSHGFMALSKLGASDIAYIAKQARKAGLEGKTTIEGGTRLMRAFHGSGADFDAFSTNNIGEGEGAQAYGYGIYFADSESVARHIKDKARDGKLYQVDLKPKEDEYLVWDKKIDSSLASMAENIVPNAWRMTGGQFYDALAKALGSQKEASMWVLGNGIKGNKYPATRRAIKAKWKNGRRRYSEDTLDIASAEIQKTGSVDAAIKSLRRKSIGPGGSKYGKAARALENKSIIVPKTDYNYVIFDDADVEITARLRRKGGKHKPIKITSSFADEFISTAKAQSWGTLTVRQITEVMKSQVPILEERYLPIFNQYETDMNILKEEAGQIAQERRKLKLSVNNRLAQLQHEATIEGVDPSEDFVPLVDDVKKAEDRIKLLRRRQLDAPGSNKEKWQTEIKQLNADIQADKKRKKQYARLLAKWNALPQNAKDIYIKERDYHLETSKETLAALLQRIADTDAPQDFKKAMMDKLQVEFNKNLRSAPYFPLARFGKFWVSSEIDGEKYFDMFESEAAQKAFINENSKSIEITGFGKQLDNLRDVDGVNPNFVAEVDSMLQELGDANIVNEVRDNIYQLYIKTLPELSARKHHIHRKKTKGFSDDQARAFADKAIHDANNIAKLRHLHRMNKVIDDAVKGLDAANSKALRLRLIMQNNDLQQILDSREASLTDVKEMIREVNAENPGRKIHIPVKGDVQSLFDEITKRIESNEAVLENASTIDDVIVVSDGLNELRKSNEAMSKTTTHPITQRLNALGFAWFLGLTPAAALVNISQTPVVALPVIGAKYGFSRTSKHMSKAAKDFLAGGFSIKKSLSKEETDAFNQWLASGLLDETLAHDLAGIADAGINTGTFRAKMGTAFSFMFHHAERMNREVTAIAAYRAARENGESHQQAVENAKTLTYRSHFDYSSLGRARFMRGNVARVVTQFKQYSQNITYLYAKTIYDIFKGASKEEKAEARRVLYGMLIGQLSVAGTLGLPMAGVAFGMAQALQDAFGDDDDPKEVKAEFRQWLADVLGKQGGQLISKGFFDTFTPYSLSGRLSVSDLWIRTSDRDLEGRAEAQEYINAALGPMASIVTNLFVAKDLLSDGKYERAIEYAVPKFLKDSIRANRFLAEDAKTMSGYKIKDMETAEAIGQMLGFSPSELSELYDVNNAINNVAKKRNRRRKTLITSMVEARKARDNAAIRTAQRKIDRWNKAHPGDKITSKTIKRSINSRRRYSESLHHGVRETKRNRDLLRRLGYARLGDD